MEFMALGLEYISFVVPVLAGICLPLGPRIRPKGGTTNLNQVLLGCRPVADRYEFSQEKIPVNDC